MRIQCAHGYFKFEESRGGEFSEFVSLFGLELSRKGDYFTFDDLVDAPDHSIQGKEYLDEIGVVTFAGQPWEIFEANEWVYNYDQGLLVPIDTITNILDLTQTGNYYYANGLLMPGSLTKDGKRLKDYAGWFSSDTFKFKYSEVGFVE